MSPTQRPRSSRRSEGPTIRLGSAAEVPSGRAWPQRGPAVCPAVCLSFRPCLLAVPFLCAAEAGAVGAGAFPASSHGRLTSPFYRSAAAVIGSRLRAGFEPLAPLCEANLSPRPPPALSPGRQGDAEAPSPPKVPPKSPLAPQLPTTRRGWASLGAVGSLCLARGHAKHPMGTLQDPTLEDPAGSDPPQSPPSLLRVLETWGFYPRVGLGACVGGGGA